MLYGHNTCNELIWFINLNSNLQAKLYFVLHPCWQLISAPYLHLKFDSQTVSRLSFLRKLFTLAHLATHLAAFFFFLLSFCMLLSTLQLKTKQSSESKRSTRLHSAPCEWAASAGSKETTSMTYLNQYHDGTLTLVAPKNQTNPPRILPLLQI